MNNIQYVCVSSLRWSIFNTFAFLLFRTETSGVIFNPPPSPSPLGIKKKKLQKKNEKSDVILECGAITFPFKDHLCTWETLLVGLTHNMSLGKILGGEYETSLLIYL